jgi:hypothetical protein
MSRCAVADTVSLPKITPLALERRALSEILACPVACGSRAAGEH